MTSRGQIPCSNFQSFSDNQEILHILSNPKSHYNSQPLVPFLNQALCSFQIIFQYPRSWVTFHKILIVLRWEAVGPRPIPPISGQLSVNVLPNLN